MCLIYSLNEISLSASIVFRVGHEFANVNLIRILNYRAYVDQMFSIKLNQSPPFLPHSCSVDSEHLASLCDFI